MFLKTVQNSQENAHTREPFFNIGAGGVCNFISKETLTQVLRTALRTATFEIVFFLTMKSFPEYKKILLNVKMSLIFFFFFFFFLNIKEFS